MTLHRVPPRTEKICPAFSVAEFPLLSTLLYLSCTAVQQPGFQRCRGFISASVPGLFIFGYKVIPRTNSLISIFRHVGNEGRLARRLLDMRNDVIR
jgi:hypothetical protein